MPKGSVKWKNGQPRSPRGSELPADYYGKSIVWDFPNENKLLPGVSFPVLSPWGVANSNRVKEVLSARAGTGVKRSPCDYAVTDQNRSGQCVTTGIQASYLLSGSGEEPECTGTAPGRETCEERQGKGHLPATPERVQGLRGSETVMDPFTPASVPVPNGRPNRNAW